MTCRSAAMPLQLAADHLGRAAAHAGVDLVEHVGQHLVGPGQRLLDRQHHPRQLAARRDLAPAGAALRPGWARTGSGRGRRRLGAQLARLEPRWAAGAAANPSSRSVAPTFFSRLSAARLRDAVSAAAAAAARAFACVEPPPGAPPRLLVASRPRPARRRARRAARRDRPRCRRACGRGATAGTAAPRSPPGAPDRSGTPRA